MKDFLFRGKECFRLLAENSGSVVQSDFYESRETFPDENLFGKVQYHTHFRTLNKLPMAFGGKFSAGFPKFNST